MKAGWTEVALGDVCDVVRDIVAPAEIQTGTRYVGLEHISPGGSLTHAPRVARGELASAKFAFDSTHVLFGKLRPNLAKVVRVPMAGICSTDILPLRSHPRLEPGYLMYFLRRPETVALATRRATGANLPRLNASELARFSMPLPPVVEQRRIVGVLDRVGRVRELRRVSSAAYQGLAIALSAEITGMGRSGTVVPLSVVADVASGITKGRLAPAGKLTATPYLAVSNVQAGRLELGTVKQIEASAAEIERFSLARDDLLLTEGGDPDKLGRGALWEGQIAPCLHQNHVFRVRIRDRDILDPRVLEAQVGSRRGRDYFLRAAKQTTGIASINKTQLSAFPVEVPSLAVQARLVARLEALGRETVRIAEHAARLDLLVASLQHRAFAGEL